MPSDLWSQARYLAPYSYILDTNIIEYDIEKANINVLRDMNLIDDETYQRLHDLPKGKRERRVGWMIKRNAGMYKSLQDGFAQARRILFDKLQLESNMILAIDNDAVFVIYSGMMNLPDEVWVTDRVKFRVKGHYRSFYYIHGFRFYYTYDPMTGMEGLDVKGIGNNGLELSRPFTQLLCDIFYSYFNGGAKEAYRVAVQTYDNFLKKNYPMDCYRRFDSWGRFDIYPISSYARFTADTLDPSCIGMVDPSYNLNILRILISFYTIEIMKL